METLVKPVYIKAPKDDIYKKIQAEVKQNILGDKVIYRHNIAKAVAYLLMFLISYCSILIFGNNILLLFLFYVLSGISMILIFVNAFHDAAHGALFRNKKLNHIFCYVLELFGSNNFVWRKRHLMLHHPYPNIPNWDVDIKQSDIVRVFPNSKFLPMHKYQHIYMWFLYPFYTLNWIFVRDFKDFFGTKDNYLKRVLEIPKIEYYKLFAAKLFNLFYMIAVPALVLQEQHWYTILLAWLVMHLVASSFGVVALLSTHADEEAHFPEPDEGGHMKNTWFMHQLEVTKDFSADSNFANLLFGGFTHHVAHHLFPGVAHTYYPKITKIIRRYAKEYHLPYRCYPFYSAMRSHFRLLKNNASENNLFKKGEL
ncbi:fatty acid desaturase [Arachidicoccus ginsenosidimutans]|uniref:fatty acid desaturase family protein n=1 Tax=Arachidicoccus sp. BS20 TaxID=1850526 RepID=UPI0007F14CA8|nr:fatty acid desaturase [Arachidicoccus sp. BS20]ANI90099.1 fatty acid desaturase [Arachidicoccus sp. BS20]